MDHKYSSFSPELVFAVGAHPYHPVTINKSSMSVCEIDIFKTLRKSSFISENLQLKYLFCNLFLSIKSVRAGYYFPLLLFAIETDHTLLVWVNSEWSQTRDVFSNFLKCWCERIQFIENRVVWKKCKRIRIHCYNQPLTSLLCNDVKFKPVRE